MKRKGILLSGGSGSRLYPLTKPISKQLLPIYNKPMIYYPISVLMLAEIREILLITTGDALALYQELLGDGEQWGLSISYCVQEEPRGLAEAFLLGEEFLAGDPCCLVLGDNFFYGANLSGHLRRASGGEGARVFGYPVGDPSAFGVVELNEEGKVVSLEEKPEVPRSSLAVPGLYFFDGRVSEYARKLIPSERGELEITDLLQHYLAEGRLEVEKMARGTAWLDTGTHDGLLDAAVFVRVVEKRQGLQVGCLEEIALQKGWISKEDLKKAIEKMGRSSYREYVETLLEG